MLLFQKNLVSEGLIRIGGMPLRVAGHADFLTMLEGGHQLGCPFEGPAWVCVPRN